VEDWPTASLMERFYRGYGAGLDPIRALAEAQRAALASSATSDPLAWAGFIVVGGAGAPHLPDVRSARVTENHTHDR